MYIHKYTCIVSHIYKDTTLLDTELLKEMIIVNKYTEKQGNKLIFALSSN